MGDLLKEGAIGYELRRLIPGHALDRRGHPYKLLIPSQPVLPVVSEVGYGPELELRLRQLLRDVPAGEVAFVQLFCLVPDELLHGRLGFDQANTHEAGLEQGIDVEEELLQLHRLGEVVLGPGPERLLLGSLVMKAAEHEDRQEGVQGQPGVDLGQQLEAVHPGHREVQHDEIGGVRLHIVDHLGRLADAGHLRVPNRGEAPREQAHDGPIVVHHQHTRIGSREHGHRDPASLSMPGGGSA